MTEAEPQIRYGWLTPSELPVAVKTRTSFGSVSVGKKFYQLLLKSVSEEGFRNPILLDNREGLRVVYGESRGWVATELNVLVPAFVNDWHREYERFELIAEPAQALSKFKDLPFKFKFGTTVFFMGCRDR